MGRPASAGWQRALRDRRSEESRQGRALGEGRGGPLARLRHLVLVQLHLDRDRNIVYAQEFGVFGKAKLPEEELRWLPGTCFVPLTQREYGLENRKTKRTL